METIQSYRITAAMFDHVADQIEEELEKAGTEKREIRNGRLLLEELFARMAPGPEDSIDVEVRRRFGDVFLKVSSDGEAMDPLRDSPYEEDDEQDQFRRMLLHANRGKLSYARRGRKNIVIIAVREAAGNGMKKTLAAMFFGLVFGVICKAVLPADVLDFLNGTILVNIRTVFLNALKMMIAPLVFFSVISSVSGMSSTAEIGRLGKKVLVFYLLTSVAASMVGVGMFMLFFGNETSLPELAVNANKAVEAAKIDPVALLVNIVPTDLVNPILKMDVLQILFVSLLFGCVMNGMKDRAAELIRIADECNSFCIQVVNLIVRILPLVAFASMASLVIKTGYASLKTLGMVLISVVLGMMLMFVVYSVLLIVIGHVSPVPFLKKAIRFVVIPFSIGSSNACIPFTMNFTVHELGVPKKLASFSIPIGSTINMDGGCISIVVEALLLAKMYGMDITPVLLMNVVLMAVLLSVGAPGVSGAAFVCLTSLIVSIGIPVEAATFVLGIDPIVSMFRVATNVTGDVAATVFTASSENVLDEETYREAD